MSSISVSSVGSRQRREHPLHHPDQLRGHHRRLPVRFRQRRHQRNGGWIEGNLPFQFGRNRIRSRLHAAGLRDRRVLRWPPGRPLGSTRGADPVGDPVPRLRDRRGHGQFIIGVHRRAHARRLRGGRGQRDVAGLHRRSRFGALPGQAGNGTADRDHQRVVHGLPQQLPARQGRGRFHRSVVAGACGLALDVLDTRRSLDPLPGAVAAHSGKPPLPDGQEPPQRSRKSPHQAVRTGRGPIEIAGNR